MIEVQQQQALRDVLQAAQTALEEGRPQESIAACQHVLRHYPDAITALRLLGEACLEAGRSDEAARAFDKAIALDPHNVLARVGLGVIAEDRGEDERAIAQFRLAWEIEPTLPQLRGELVRLYRKRYGAGGRLRLTRVALANLHRRNDDLLRAIGQLRQLHREDPTRPEVTLGLAEALWRHDEDEDAALLCHALLAERPRTARALLILASIQGDSGVGTGPGVDELLATARGCDPDLALTGELIGLRHSDTLVSFAGDAPTVPAFDPATAPIGGTDEFLAQDVAGATPMTRWEDITSGLTNETSSIRSATALGVVNAVPTTAPAAAADEVDELFAAIDRELANTDEHGTGPLSPVLPFTLPEEQEEPAEAAPDWQTSGEDTMMPTPDEPSAVERLTANWENIDNELAAARPRDDQSAGMTGMLSALGDMEDDLIPFDVDTASQEEEETIKFDPSKFSLPPLDGDDEDDLEIEAAAGEDEILPFTLESAGVRGKPAGQTFADLVSKRDTPRPSAAGAGDAARDAEQGAVTAAASIFATRELSSLSEDQLLRLQADIADLAPRPQQPDALTDSAPLAATIPTAAGTDAPPAPDTAPQPLGTAEATADPSPAMDASQMDASQAEHLSSVSSSTAELDKLLSTAAPRMITPPPSENYPVDATRPLLGDEAYLLGSAVSSSEEDHLISRLPAAPAEEEEAGMDQLFNRLRHRKQERIQTGELLVNRRLQSSGTPGADTGEIAGPLSATQRREHPGSDASTVDAPVPIPYAASPDAEIETSRPAPTWEELEQPGDEVVPGADTAVFLAALADEDAALAAAEPLLPTADPGGEVAIDDHWLTALVDDGAAKESEWAAFGEEPEAPAESSSPGDFAALLEERAPERLPAPPAATPDPAAADDWEITLPRTPRDDMPEQPAPPSSARATGASDGMPHWGEETINDAAAPAPLAHAAPYFAPQDSVVMGARTNGASGGAAQAGANALAAPPRSAQRQTEQLAQLAAMVEAQPDNHFLRLTLAIAHVSGRQPDQALTEYRRLIKEADELLPEVVERLKEMIADGDAPARAHRVLGDAYMKLGQFDLAMAEFQRALSARPRGAK